MVISAIGRFLKARKEAWEAFAQQVGGQFHHGAFFQNSYDQVTIEEGNWIYLLDHDQEHTPYRVRMRVAFKLTDRNVFPLFSLGEETLFDKIPGFQGVKVGHSLFDARFCLNAYNREIASDLFSDPVIRDLCLSQPTLKLALRNSYGLLKYAFPKGVFELFFIEAGRKIHDPKRLLQIQKLLSEILNHLAKKGIVSRDHPGIRLRSGPNGNNGEYAWEREPRSSRSLS
ncbi:MAG: hypothetical protein MI742_00480 [Desulfobacterales bacterium]|nr:hypothetical protein [Desulfobacterales bacterium]